MEATLGVVAVEDDAVDTDGDYLDDDLNEGADEGPALPSVSGCQTSNAYYARSLPGAGKRGHNRRRL